MPEVTFFVGKDGIDRCVIQEKNFFTRVALVVFFNPICERGRDCGPIPLREDTGACVYGFLGLNDAFLRVRLIIERQNFELLTARAALGIDLVRKESRN